ncbi:hypothetical protein IQ06DRAFT_89626 [Phaeosphaeriaceae sp. SRC1lsM3a]|nr:hypothetical protein IQ06DRAFT_89626 [Stagonospora sp. SRC1lsM3a]
MVFRICINYNANLPSNQIWLGGVVGYHVSLTRHSPSDTEGPEFKPRLSHQIALAGFLFCFCSLSAGAVVVEIWGEDGLTFWRGCGAVEHQFLVFGMRMTSGTSR